MGRHKHKLNKVVTK